MLDVAGADLPTFLPIDQARNKAEVVAQMRVDALQASLNLSQILADRQERLHDVPRKSLRRFVQRRNATLPAALSNLATAQRGHGIEEYLHFQVVPPFAPEVRHGIKMCDATNELAQLLTVLGHRMQDGVVVMLGLQHLHSPFVLDRLYYQSPRLFFNCNQLGDILVLETCPTAIQSNERVPPLRPSWPRCLRQGGRWDVTVDQRPEFSPSPLQGLRPAHRLSGELKRVAVDPNHGVLLHTRFEHIHAVVAGLVGKKCTVVDREGQPI
mmetsp:Transcript_31299/g.91265  ORF Transcript_31299/g.91265 Transcript_31299/m.91265 type:complete len:268 (-) Transcript_31299:306-1109(-)